MVHCTHDGQETVYSVTPKDIRTHTMLVFQDSLTCLNRGIDRAGVYVLCMLKRLLTR